MAATVAPLAATVTANASVNDTDIEVLTGDDAAWALTCAFLILTMQTGFAMLECGCVSSKNMANIMIKNVCDVSIGGLAYWMFGYGLTFGHPATWFCGLGDFFFTETRVNTMGSRYSKYFFQFSFASTATTIVSGAVAERMTLHAYMVFSFVNTIIYCIPAAWCWGDAGFLGKLGFFDFAGVCVVHLNGGMSALVSSLVLGCRLNRWDKPENYVMSSPVTALTGMFMLTWAWLGFNCGSTFGVSDSKWKVSALVAVTTLNGGIGGGVAGLALSMIAFKAKIRVDYIINTLLGGLVSVTGICAVTTPTEALIIGAIGGGIAVAGQAIMDKLKIDDPVGAVPVHFCTAVWGTLAVGIFARRNASGPYGGILHGGSFHLIGVQLLACVCIAVWAGTLTFCQLKLINLVIDIRMSVEEELLGADLVEHDIRHPNMQTGQVEDALRNLEGNELSEMIIKMLNNNLHQNQPRTNLQENASHRVFSKKDPPGPTAEQVLGLRNAVHDALQGTSHDPTSMHSFDNGTDTNGAQKRMMHSLATQRP